MSWNQKYLFANVLSRFLEYPSLPGGNIDSISTCMRLLSVPECIMKDTKVNCLMHLSLSLSPLSLDRIDNRTQRKTTQTGLSMDCLVLISLCKCFFNQRLFDFWNSVNDGSYETVEVVASQFLDRC